MQLVLPGMLSAGRGAIINVSSDAARRPGEGPYEPGRLSSASLAYSVNKLSIESLTQHVAAEVVLREVAVNVLLASLPIDTPGLRFFSPDPGETSTAAAFAEAAIRLILVDPAETAGRIAYHEDVLHASADGAAGSARCEAQGRAASCRERPSPATRIRREDDCCGAEPAAGSLISRRSAARVDALCRRASRVADQKRSPPLAAAVEPSLSKALTTLRPMIHLWTSSGPSTIRFARAPASHLTRGKSWV